jgi:zinc protease
MAKAMQALSLTSIPGADDITRVELANGITVLARHNPHSLSFTLRGYLQAGGIYEADEKLGLADFVSSALMRGTQQRSFNEIYERLESIGASLGFNSGTHTVGFGARALTEDLPVVLDLLSETLRTPSFPENEIEKLRAQLLTGLSMRAQDTRDMASLVFDELVYAGHPYGRAEEGHPETVSAITRADLQAFHATHIGPREMVVVIVGSLEPAQAVEAVRGTLEHWTNEQQPPSAELPEWLPLAEPAYKRHEIPGKSQSDLIVGSAGPRRLDLDYLPAMVGNNILGRFGLMGRIGDVVREEAGLAYYAYSGLGGGIGPGAWTVEAGVNPGNEEQATELILSELRRFTNELVEESELSDSQSNIIGGMPLSLESNSGVASALLNIQRYGLDLDYYRQFPELVANVTREQIRETAARHLDSRRLAVTAAGPTREVA